MNIKTICAIVLAASLTACGTVETGNVGVRTWFGEVSPNEVTPGFYTSIISSVDEFSAKEIEVPLENLTPKAKDNLSLQDLDVSVYYSVDPGKVTELHIKYANAHHRDENSRVMLPAYRLVERIARNIVYSEVSEYDSLVMHTKRETLAGSIKEELANELERNDPGVFKINRVVVRALNTDSSIENAIRDVVANQKKLESMAIQDQIAQKEADIEITRAHGIAEANRIINNSLTREYLQHEANLALMKFAENGKSHTVVVPANMQSAPLINIR